MEARQLGAFVTLVGWRRKRNQRERSGHLPRWGRGQDRSYLHEISGVGKSRETRNRPVVARSWEEGGMGSDS